MRKQVALVNKPKGTFGTLAEICKTEGFSGLYRGVSAPILAVAPIFAVRIEILLVLIYFFITLPSSLTASNLIFVFLGFILGI